ncbi:SpoOJ regulator protein [Atopobium minutum]|uniref:Chromosome segregation ATPase n=1 Tax=Atopobium minutum TaxID=1381 RepID=A0AB38A7D8_9ACTN|nr:AAA family ATPase [Atopobium minutum]KRN55681.1 SpoOJ regulator protein [Atopobium minutum]SEB69985.1 chromosome segregation ATPase [Atopobium minutum]
MDYRDVSKYKEDEIAKVISIINQKGGVGKSTTAVNLSSALGELKRKVLVIDLDPQGNTTSGYGIDKEELETDIYDVLLNGDDVTKNIIQTIEPHVFVLPTTIQLAGAEIDLVNVKKREYVLKEIINSIKEEFDYVFIDCPPSLGLLTINAFVAADSLIIPIQCEYYALEGLSKLLESMEMVQSKLNPDLEVFGVLMTMYDSRTTLSNQVVEEVRAYFKNKVFKTVIPRSVKIAEAPSHGLPINKYSRLNKGCLAYSKLAKEVTRRG